MNTKGNQRYQETKNRIKGSFLALLKQGNKAVSVRMLCDYAKIHRTTFYGHYEDINALLQEMVADLYLQMMNYFVPEQGKFDINGFDKLFQLAKEEKEFFLYYFDNIRPELRQEILVPELLLEHHLALEERMGLKNEEELMYQQSFFSAGSTALLIRWLKKGCKESPEEMGKLMKKNYDSFFGGFS